MRWLLLSDLHLGIKNESQHLALRGIVEEVDKVSHHGDVDMVLMAGDLAYSGKPEEYDEVSAKLIEPLRELQHVKHARFVAVPGNHDVDCDLGYPPTISALGTSIDEFFHLNERGVSLRRPTAGRFQAYADFIARCGIDGVDPIKLPAVAIQHEQDDVRVNIVCVVTSYFSSKHLANERHNVPAPIHALRTLVRDSNDAEITIILAHHPQNWFTPETESQLESLLVDRNAIYLHGHEHRVLANFGRRGLTSLGFGALYQDSLDSKPTPYYRNSFAICELDDKLHVDIRTWDAENGRWVSDQNLPANFDEKSDRLQGGRVLPLPTTLLKDRLTVTSGSAVHVLPMAPRLKDCYWLAKDTKTRWLGVLEELGVIETPKRSFERTQTGLAEGHLQLLVEDRRGGRRVIHVVSAHGDVISNDHVVSLNTQLDTETLSGCSIVTLGELSDDARKLVARLGATKPIEAIDRTEFLRLWLMRSTSPLVAAVQSSEYDSASVSLLVTDSSYGVIVTDRLRNQWFSAFDGTGIPVAESDGLVKRIRDQFPIYARLRYGVPDMGGAVGEANSGGKPESPDVFLRTQYLERSFRVFDDVRYAPLAALGIRFRSTSLSEIYIQTGADLGGESKADQGLQRAINEYVESLNLEPPLRDQLESQMRSQYGLGRTAEVGVARQLYQRYGCVVILGDPGSGKTCFVKHEILAYCRPPPQNSTWYEKHLPIYVSLSEAAELLRNESDLLAVCSTVSARNQLALPRAVIEEHLSDGRAAFFFDGLDEVSRIDERVELLSKIEQLVDRFARYGNRFVLTSRPAAVQPVDIPSAFTYLHLKGLADQEIRVLAERVLTTRLVPEDTGEISQEEKGLIEKLLEHVRGTPGLRRISRNPLLLTLLILIYANTGSLSARRHLVYTQAVKTLVTVRHRESMEQVLSEADLRTHLGQLAFAIYQREINELPSRKEVLELLTQDGIDEGSLHNNSEEAGEFIRSVAESTGILVIHSRPSRDDPLDDIVTFMHYSFLEYYAAVGFLARDYEDDLVKFASDPHWRDVVTLMFGLRSEHYDITPQIKMLAQGNDRLEAITNEKLLLAFECALECDVPPQETQAVLVARMGDSLSSGAMKHSEYLRDAVARFVDQVVVAAGGQLFEDALARGMNARDGTAAAAFIDLAGRLKEPAQFGSSVVQAFEDAFTGRKEPTLRAACIGACTRRLDLRTDRVLEELRECLSGNVVEKHAALRGMESRPELCQRFSRDVARLLDDGNAVVSSSAARAILLGGVDGHDIRKDEIAIRKALGVWQGSARPLPVDGAAISLDGGELRNLIDSTNASDVELGARLLPLSDLEDKHVYRALIEALHRGIGHSADRACLDALRIRAGALDLITLGETDFICRLTKSPNRDVRIGALRVLGVLPHDELVVGTLCQFCNIGSETNPKALSADEEREGFAALATHARDSVWLQGELVSTVLQSLPGPGERRFGDALRQRRLGNLMFACERVGAIVESRLTNRLLDLAKDYRTPRGIRLQALRTFGRTVSPNVAAVDELIRLLGIDDRSLNEALYAGCYWFLGQCRKRVEFVRLVYGRLPELRDALVDAWFREIPRVSDRIDAASVEDIRRSLGELENVLISYGGFSDRMKLSDLPSDDQ